MKGKTKTQKGITLVALIITIVILLILAAVAVATIQDDGILSRANEAGTLYNQKVGEEGQLLGSAYDKLNSYFTEEVEYSLIEGYNLQPSNGTLGTVAGCMVTDFIPVESGYNYTVSENQTYTIPEGSYSTARGIVYDENKNFLCVVYDEQRINTGTYTRKFIIPQGGAYLRCQFRITDTDIKIVKDGQGENLKLSNLIYKHNSYTQGMCVSEEFIFVSSSVSWDKDPNDYKIKKVNRTTGEIVATSEESFNHANDMTYNEDTNELLVILVDGNATSSNGTPISVSDDDYCLGIVDADTLTLKTKVNLKDIILAENSECVGIVDVEYNSVLKEYYILTRYPERRIITLNSDFTRKSSVHLYNCSDYSGTEGGMTSDEQYIYISSWRDDINRYINYIEIYDRTGKLVKVQQIYGITHIESIDFIDNKTYCNFIDFDDYTYPAKIYEVEKIQ